MSYSKFCWVTHSFKILSKQGHEQFLIYHKIMNNIRASFTQMLRYDSKGNFGHNNY